MQLVIGRILRPHGVRGEVAVVVSTDEPELRYRPGAVLATDPAAAGPLRVEAARPHHGGLLVTFAGYEDRTQAESLRGVRLYVESGGVATPTEPDEYHDFQLVGLAVVDPAGTRLGEVVRIEHGPGADRLVVRLTAGKTALVPFVAAIVPRVDLDAALVEVDAPEGLWDL